MSDKTICTGCGAEILQTTADKTGGLCMPCKNGYRKQMEESKEYYKRERELDKTCPFRALWRELVNKDCNTKSGFLGFTENEKIYYSVNVLLGEVYNGGFDQYFTNSSGEQYSFAYRGLKELNALKSIELLEKAKNEFFGSNDAPIDQEKRWKSINETPNESLIDEIESEFWEDPDNLSEKLEEFAFEKNLVENS